MTLHLPLTPETRGLISRRRLEQMPEGSVLVNTARGPLVDEIALAELLTRGHLGGAALDVFCNEPHPAPALLAAPRLVLMPHIGSADFEARSAMAALACEAVAEVLAGRMPRNRVA